MISSINATIEYEKKKDEDGNNSSVVRSIYVALEPECRANSKGRSDGVETNIVLEDTRVGVSISTRDVSTLRAVLNSYLRFLDAAHKSLTVTR